MIWVPEALFQHPSMTMSKPTPVIFVVQNGHSVFGDPLANVQRLIVATPLIDGVVPFDGLRFRRHRREFLELLDRHDFDVLRNV